jgi:hypothetical protein
MPFKFTGFADEAEKTLDEQISTLKEVGWSAIELRLIDGKNVVDQTDEEWARTLGETPARGDQKWWVLVARSPTGHVRSPRTSRLILTN